MSGAAALTAHECGGGYAAAMPAAITGEPGVPLQDAEVHS
jgi:hypothetical protein